MKGKEWILPHDVLLINLTDNAIDCLVRRLVIGIQQAIRVPVEALSCHLLLVSSRDHLKSQI